MKNYLNDTLGNPRQIHPGVSELIMDYIGKFPKYKIGDPIQIIPSLKSRSLMNKKENDELYDYETAFGLIVMIHKNTKTNKYRYTALTNKCKDNTNTKDPEYELLLLYEDDINPTKKYIFYQDIPSQIYINQMRFITKTYKEYIKNKTLKSPHWINNQIYLLENIDSIFPYTIY